MKKFLYIAIYLFLTSCASNNQDTSFEEKKLMLENRLESWLGAKETEIIQVYGIPDSIYTTDNVKYILYEIEKSQYVLNIGYGVVVTEGCEITFNIQDNIISSYTYKGWNINDCLALIYSSRETDFVDSNVG